MKRTLYSLLILLLSLGLVFFILKKINKPAPKPIIVQTASFEDLPGWQSANLAKSLSTFQRSCQSFLKQDPRQKVGSDFFPLTAGEWQPICLAAKTIQSPSKSELKHFFQTWFQPVSFYQNTPLSGLFTGYYMPVIEGSLKKTSFYQVPLYGLPSNLITANLEQFDPNLKGKKITGFIQGQRFLPYPTREKINQGALEGKAKILAWIHSPVDRVFLEIQGSGLIRLEDGEILSLGYAGENGAPYTALASVLIKKGILTKDTASMQAIKLYLESHPEEMDTVLHQNKSFVFFRVLHQQFALGAQGLPLTPGYSLAVDKKWIPLGAPLWLNTSRPQKNTEQSKPFQRLMIAQDTGGAIRGMVRGDVYWGATEKAAYIAGHMRNRGQYWVLLPKTLATQFKTEHSQ